MHVPPDIVDLIDAPRPPGVSLSPDRRRLLIMEPPPLPPLAELAEEELRLAGIRINPRASARSRASYSTGLRVRELPGGDEQAVRGLPESPRIGNAVWSPDGRRLAFRLTFADRCELWVADLMTHEAHRLSDVIVNGAAGSSIFWHPDGQSVFCEIIPPNRGAPPEKPANLEPVVQKSDGEAAPARTFQDLLKDAHDEALFEFYLSAQLARVTLEGQVSFVGPRGVFANVDSSPDGDLLLVETIVRPYSYLVPAGRFPRRVELWNMSGKTVRQVADLPLAENIPPALDAVRAGPRGFFWRADSPATLVWAEAPDGGDPDVQSELRDQLFVMSAPNGRPEPWLSFTMRFRGAAFCHGELALVREGWWKTRRQRVWKAAPGDLSAPAELVFDRSTEDSYNDPGRPIMRRNDQGRRVLFTGDKGDSIYLIGDGAEEKGSRPFLDRFHLPTLTATRLWRSQPPRYESVVGFVADDEQLLLIGREAVEEPRNYFLLDASRGELQSVTAFAHPTPQLKHVRKELLRYARADGVMCTATLYLPRGYRQGDPPLPVLMWAYPIEFKSADAAGQVTRSPHRFISVPPLSPLLWLTQGYAVLNAPTMPIVGEDDREPNDTYLEQLIASAAAAVHEIVRRGVADPRRLAIAGHSYGGFTAANLLAHSDLFRCGVAMSGAYNRTLTPFGFQAEERTLWQAPDVYMQMSPFTHAAKIDRPLLLIHGAADENAGTHSLQSDRFYQALRGHGAVARLVLLPHEGHSYRARESLLRVAAEVTAWLEKHMPVGGPPIQARSASE